MKAKCPVCKGAGCARCKDGQIDVSFGEGPLYTRACLDPACGFENGGYIVMEGMKKAANGEPPEASGPCIECEGPTRWKLVGEMLEDRVLPDTTE